ATSSSVNATDKGFSGLGGFHVIVATRSSWLRLTVTSEYSVTFVGLSVGTGYAGLSAVSEFAMGGLLRRRILPAIGRLTVVQRDARTVDSRTSQTWQDRVGSELPGLNRGVRRRSDRSCRTLTKRRRVGRRPDYASLPVK